MHSITEIDAYIWLPTSVQCHAIKYTKRSKFVGQTDCIPT